MGEGRCRRRVGEVVGGYVNALDRGDRAFGGGSDALLQGTEVGGQGRLVTNGRRNAAEQRRNLGPGLGEAEDVVHEEEHVLALFVAEVLGRGQTGQGDTGPGPGRFGHLAVHQRGLGQNAGFLHFMVQVVALAGPLANAAEHGDTAVLHGDVVDHFHHDNGLAATGAAEQAHLAAAREGNEQVDDLDARLEYVHLGVLLDE